jgi:hypothetical protein
MDTVCLHFPICVTFILIRADILQSPHDGPHGACSSVGPDPFRTDSAAGPSHASAPPNVDMNSSAYYWGASTTCSSTDESVDEGHAQYERALPTPMYSSLLPSYPAQQMSPIAVQPVLPDRQLHLLPPGRPTGDVMNMKLCNQAGWPL